LWISKKNWGAGTYGTYALVAVGIDGTYALAAVGISGWTSSVGSGPEPVLWGARLSSSFAVDAFCSGLVSSIGSSFAGEGVNAGEL